MRHINIIGRNIDLVIKDLYEAFPYHVDMQCGDAFGRTKLAALIDDDALQDCKSMFDSLLVAQKYGLIQGDYFDDGIIAFFWKAQLTPLGAHAVGSLLSSGSEINMSSLAFAVSNTAKNM